MLDFNSHLILQADIFISEGSLPVGSCVSMPVIANYRGIEGPLVYYFVCSIRVESRSYGTGLFPSTRFVFSYTRISPVRFVHRTVTI